RVIAVKPGVDTVFVQRTGRDPGYETLPNAGVTGSHGISEPVPVVEFSNYGDPFGVRSPDREVYAAFPVQLRKMGAELLISPVMRALREEVVVICSQKRSR